MFRVFIHFDLEIDLIPRYWKFTHISGIHRGFSIKWLFIILTFEKRK